MDKSAQFAVLGLGRFGQSIVKTLTENGYNVLACDVNEELVNEVSAFATHAVQVDFSDQNALESLGIGNYDVVVVAIGTNLEASIMATMKAKELGARFVIAKATSYMQKHILEKVGADRVVLPEREMGMKIAMNLITKNAIDYLNLSEEFGITEMKPLASWIGKSIQQADIRATTNLTVIAILRGGTKMNLSPKLDEVIMKDDLVVVVGANEDIIRCNAGTGNGDFGGFFDKKLF